MTKSHNFLFDQFINLYKKKKKIFNQSMTQVLYHYVQYPNNVQHHDDENVLEQSFLLDML